jgi:hypothetical protein
MGSRTRRLGETRCPYRENHRCSTHAALAWRLGMISHALPFDQLSQERAQFARGARIETVRRLVENLTAIRFPSGDNDGYQ